MTYPDPWDTSPQTVEGHRARTLDMMVDKGITYRYRPGPAIDEQVWLRDGFVATVTGEVYSARYLG